MIPYSLSYLAISVSAALGSDLPGVPFGYSLPEHFVGVRHG